MILSILVIHLVTIRPDHDWGDDFALYVAHARNIAEGRPYDQTGYIENPSAPEISPRSYPPGLPVLLAPVWRLYGLNFAAFKVVIVILFGIALTAVQWTFHHDLPCTAQCVLIALLGLNPYVFHFRQNVLSDLPFLALVYLIIALVMAHDAVPTSKRVFYGLVIGILAYAAYATRTVGAVIMIALLVHDLVLHRRLQRSLFAASVLFLLLAYVQACLLPGQTTYLDVLRRFDPAVFAYNLLFYPISFYRLWGSGATQVPGMAIHVVMLALAAYGIACHRPRRFSILYILAALYGAALLAWPVRGSQRFLLPLLPLFLFYVVKAAQLLTVRLSAWPRVGACALGLAIVGASSAAAYTQQAEEVGSQRPTDPAFLALCSFISRETPSDSVFLFAQPRALALFTGRRASVCHRANSDELWRYIDSIGAQYLVTSLALPANTRVVLSALQSTRRPIVKTYENDVYSVYSLRLPRMYVLHKP